jgi:fibronectin-binding autotransporter adhesin
LSARSLFKVFCLVGSLAFLGQRCHSAVPTDYLVSYNGDNAAWGIGSNSGSLREAVANANAGVGLNQIDWNAGIAGTLVLATDLVVNPNTIFNVGSIVPTLAGNGATATNAVAITNAAGGINLVAGPGSLDLHNDYTNNFIIVSAIYGSGSLSKSGNGIVTLEGGNTYTGGTTINAGTLYITNDVCLGGGPLTFSGGTLGISGNIASARPFYLNGSGTINTNSYNMSVSGPIADGVGSGGLNKIGSGTLFLNAANTYTGGTMVSSGLSRPDL